MNCWPASTEFTTMLSSREHAVEIETPYLASMVPGFPRRSWPHTQDQGKGILRGSLHESLQFSQTPSSALNRSKYYLAFG